MSRLAGRARLGVPAVLAGICVALVAVASTASPKGGTAAGRLTSLSAAGDVVGIVVLVAGAGSVGALLWALWPDRGEQPRDEASDGAPPVPWWRRVINAAIQALPFAVAAGLLAVAFGHPRRRPSRTVSGLSALSGRLGGQLAGGVAHPHVAVGSVEVVGIVAGGLIALAMSCWAAWWYRRRSKRRAATAPGEPAQAQAGLEGAASRALDELGREVDPRRAILAAYRALEEGVLVPAARRRPSEAPLEFRDRLVAAGAPRLPAGRLTELFEVARFSDHVIEAGARDDAMAALEVLRGSGGGAP